MKTVNFIDGFCGAGGASLGIEQAGCKVSVAVNHDPRAIWAHNRNHPDTYHFNADIREIDTKDVAKEFDINAIWWSAECTHFSNAKGGASRDADSRMLSEELIRYARDIDPDWIFVENVKEFFSWTSLVPKYKSGKRLKGLEKRYSRIQIELFDAVIVHETQLKELLSIELDSIYVQFQESKAYEMDKDGKITMLPDKSTNGLLYLRWVQALKDLGYRYDWRMINSADLGAYQSRERYFGVFVKESLNIAPRFPKQTHAKNPSKSGGLFDTELKPWNACRDILDLNDKGESIFYGRKGKKPLVAATLARLRHGIMKFKHEAVLIDRSNTGASPTNANDSISTVRASFQNVVVNVQTLDNYTHGSACISPNDPLPTVMAKRDKYLANAFISQQFGGPSNGHSIHSPLWALTTTPKAKLVVPFFAKYYGNGDNTGSTLLPCGTLTTKDRIGIANCNFISYYFGGGKGNSADRTTSINGHINTIGTSHIPLYISGSVILADSDLPIVLQHAPKPTTNGNIIIPAWTRIVNGYLVDNRIIDLNYRMLKVDELKQAQGFPIDYILDQNSETVAKKHIGNAVHVLCAQKLVEVNCGAHSAYLNKTKSQVA